MLLKIYWKVQKLFVKILKLKDSLDFHTENEVSAWKYLLFKIKNLTYEHKSTFTLVDWFKGVKMDS